MVDAVEPSISTELEPPNKEDEPFHKLGTIFIINLFAIKNATTSEETNEILTDEFAEQNPSLLGKCFFFTHVIILEEEEQRMI